MREKEQEQPLTEQSIKEEQILKPTISSEDLIAQRRQTNLTELSKKVEQYNYRQGFRTSKQVPGIKILDKKEEINQKQISIKPPKKRIKPLKILLIVILLLIISGGGYFIYSSGLLDKNEEILEEQNEEEQEENKEKTINYSCTFRDVDTEFYYNTNVENKYYTKDNKLKKVEYLNMSEYYEEMPKYLYDICPKINEGYRKYDGYEKDCFITDNLSITTITIIDLEVLQEKELTFNYGVEDTFIIEENLDDDVYDYLEAMEAKGYTCVQFDED